MEKQTVTIEVDRWVASVLLWCAGGAVLAFVVFFATYDPADHWASIISTSVASMGYVVIVFMFALRPPVPLPLAVVLLILVTGAAGGYLRSGNEMHLQTHDQSNRLIDIRSDIGRNVLTLVITDTLLYVLKEYHSTDRARPGSIGRFFRERYPEAKIGENMLKPYGPSGHSLAIPIEMSEDGVTLVGVDPIGPGWRADFKTADGGQGGVQFRARLTSGGIVYALEN